MLNLVCLGGFALVGFVVGVWGWCKTEICGVLLILCFWCFWWDVTSCYGDDFNVVLMGLRLGLDSGFVC